MKAISGIFAVLFLLGCTTIQQAPNEPTSAIKEKDVAYNVREGDDGIRKRIVVLPFLSSTEKQTDNVKKVARETFVRHLQKTGSYIIVSNADFPKDVSNFLKDEEYDLDAIGKMAAAMGINAVIEGKIMEIKARRIGDDVGVFRSVKARVDASVRIRVINALNGKEVMNEVRSATEEASTTRVAERAYTDVGLEDDPELIRAVVIKAFEGSVSRLIGSIDKISWEGKVALVSGDRIYLNAGRLSGIQIGDILKVTEEGEEVYDPDTGLLIGKIPGRMKGTLEVISYFGKDGSIAIVHSGSGFRENDKVELY